MGREVKTTISVPSHTKVLIVEDAAIRIRWFREKLLNPTVVTNKQDALLVLRNGAPYDLVFLDHDSVPIFWTKEDKDTMTFYDVAKRLHELEYSGKVILHSLNSDGRKRMLSLLRQTADVVELPYGTFEIVHD